eukprot:700002_1
MTYNAPIIADLCGLKKMVGSQTIDMSQRKLHQTFSKREYKVMHQIVSTALDVIYDKQGWRQFTKRLCRKHMNEINIGNRPHDRRFVPKIIDMAFEHIKTIRAEAFNTILPSTGNPPQIKVTQDKGKSGRHKLEVGDVVYWNVDAQDYVSESLVYHVLSYEDGKDASVISLVMNYCGTFHTWGLTKPHVEEHVVCNAADNEYHEKKYYDHFTRIHRIKELRLYIRDPNHNFNLQWHHSFKDRHFAWATIISIRSIYLPTRHGAIYFVHAQQTMLKMAISINTFAVTKFMQHHRRTYQGIIVMSPAINNR